MVSSWLWGVSRTFPSLESLLGLVGEGGWSVCLVVFCVHVKRFPYVQKLTASKQPCLMSFPKWYLAPPCPGRKRIFTPAEMGQQRMLEAWEIPGGGMPFGLSLGSSCAADSLSPDYHGTVRWKVCPCIVLAAKVISQGKVKKKVCRAKQLRSPISVVIFDPWLLIWQVPGTSAQCFWIQLPFGCVFLLGSQIWLGSKDEMRGAYPGPPYPCLKGVRVRRQGTKCGDWAGV